MAITDSQIRCMKKDFADGISVRSSAKNAGVAKVTVERWRRKWMFEDGGYALSCIVSKDTKKAFSAEAARRGLNSHQLLTLLVATVVDDGLFDAVVGEYSDASAHTAERLSRVPELWSQDLSVEQIASRLSLSIGQVKWQISKIRKPGEQKRYTYAMYGDNEPFKRT